MFEFMVLQEGGQRYFFDLEDGSLIELSTHPVRDSRDIRVELELKKKDKCSYEIAGTWGPMAGKTIPGKIEHKTMLTLLPGDYRFQTAGA